MEDQIKLSKEQLEKIESNKAAALLRKQQILNSKAANSPNRPPPLPNPTRIANGFSASKTGPNNVASSSSDQHVTNSVPSQKIPATLKPISEDKFMVDMIYHGPTIDIFRTIPGKAYDPVTKKWTFSLSSYDVLVSKLRNSQLVSLSEIPKNILKVLQAPYQNPDEIDLSKIDPVLVNKLMPFQADGVRFGISRGGRCLIADDMGLGKTLQALGIAHYYKENWPLLIVCPSSMRFPWEQTIQESLPSVSPFHVAVMTSSKDPIKEFSVVICSYDLLKGSVNELLERKFGVIILDESHFLKSQKSVRTSATIKVAEKCKNVILLSGTPALSRPVELYSQINLIDPVTFKHFFDFGMRYCDGKKERYGYNFLGSSNMEELQIYLKKKLMIRRLKIEVASQLPSKLRKVIILHPTMIKSVSKRMQYFASEMDSQKGREKHSTMITWYQETGSAKLNAVCDYIEDKLECSRKFLIFGHHGEMLNGISDLLRRKNVDYIRIDGSTNSELRKNLCDKFQTVQNCRVAVLSLKAANSGITLTAAQLVIFAELYWNPGELTQAEDRAHRIGQDESVVVEYLVAKGTADDYLWRLLQSKLSVLNKVGLSKDNFRDACTEHVSGDRNQLTLTSMLKSGPTQIEQMPDDLFEGLDDDDEFFEEFEIDDVMANVNIDEMVTESEIEKKRRKVAN